MNRQSTMDRALELAARGFRVFPIGRGKKRPAVKGWRQVATFEPDEVRALFAPFPHGNIGIATGRTRDGFVAVLDVDVKEGKDGSRALGLQSLASLDMLADDDWQETATVGTASGGMHLYYETTKPLRNSASKVAPGLDIRAEGGFVVAPGSITVADAAEHTVDGEYTAPASWALRAMPDWLEEKALGGADDRAADGAPIEWETSDAAMTAAERYLNEAEPAIEGQGGDARTLQVAMKVRDLGVSAGACLDLMLAGGWNERCEPPWSADELQVKIENAYRYAKDKPGNKAVEDAFEEVEGEDMAAVLTEIKALSPTATVHEVKKPRRKLFFELPRDAEPDLDKVALVDNWLDQGAFSVVYGASNVGKTFVCMGLAFSVSTGTAWNGHKVVQGAVVYVAAEAGTSARKRVKALRLHHNRHDFPFALVPCPVDLLRPQADTKPLVALIKEVEETLGQPVRLVVIDTLSRALAGGNENGPEDMGAFVGNIDTIRDSCGAHVMVVHHSGKDEARGARGHSLLRAATDTEVEVTKGVVSAKKQRDMEQQPDVGFMLSSVEIGTRFDGAPVSSAVAVFGEVQDELENGAADDFAPVDTASLPRLQKMAVQALGVAIELHGLAGPRGVRVADKRQWLDAFTALYAAEAQAGVVASGREAASGAENIREVFRRQRRDVLKLRVVDSFPGDLYGLPRVPS